MEPPLPAELVIVTPLVAAPCWLTVKAFACDRHAGRPGCGGRIGGHGITHRFGPGEACARRDGHPGGSARRAPCAACLGGHRHAARAPGGTEGLACRCNRIGAGCRRRGVGDLAGVCAFLARRIVCLAGKIILAARVEAGDVDAGPVSHINRTGIAPAGCPVADLVARHRSLRVGVPGQCHSCCMGLLQKRGRIRSIRARK